MSESASVSGNPVTCSRCGASRTPDLANRSERPPCPNCGATGITVHVSLSDSATVTESLSIEMTPADQTRGWRRRWEEAERELRTLLRPLTGSVDGESIHAARHRLHSFFVQTYHIKDALIDEAATTGVPAATVEAAITADPPLALLADLANLDKHGNLNRPPRSSHVPVIGPVSGTSDDSAPGQWRLKLVITHAGHTLDGLQVAQDAIDAWRRTLTGWGLL